MIATPVDGEHRAMIRVFATANGLVLELGGEFRKADGAFEFDAIFAAEEPIAMVTAAFAGGVPWHAPEPADLVAPIQNQEVWASGVTYLRSKDARMEEAREAGGGNFYDRVYDAERPELFFKATAATRGRAGRQGADPQRLEVECAGAGTDAGDQFAPAGSSATPLATT